jgi:hypothetical protein
VRVILVEYNTVVGRVLVVLAVAGCANLPILICPKDGGPEWHELASPHFRLRTDVPLQRARRLIGEYEEIWTWMAPTIDHFAPKGPPPSDTDLVLFAQPRDLKALEGRFDGIFVSEGDRPVIVMSGAGDLELFKHELVHRFLRARMRSIPIWLNEGLADYLSSARLVDGKVELGAVPQYRQLKAELLRYLPAPDRVVRVSSYEFYSFAWKSLYYPAAWALIHLLAESSEPKLVAFIRDVAEGRDKVEAFLADVGRTESLVDPFRAHLKAVAEHPEQAPRRRLPGTSAAELMASLEEKTLGEEEVHLLWAWLARDREEEQLDALESHAGDVPSLHYHRALVSAERGYLDTANRELARLSELAKGNVGWEQQAIILSISFAERDPDKLAALQPRVARLAEATSASVLNKAAWYYALRRQPSLGLPLARRALELNPDNAGILDTLALLLYQSGDVKGALATQQQALMCLGDSWPIAAGMIERLRMYGGAR